MSAEYQPSSVAKAALVAANNGLSNEPNSRQSRFSVAALWSMAAENDAEIQDELTLTQRKLRELKLKISSQSKRNFILERDVRYLDGRIALLIQNRMALHEQQEVASHLEEVETIEGTLDDRKRQLYGNLFHLLQVEPRHIAGLTRIVTLAEIDTLLQTVMFTLYGNQYETREEYLLLSMFQNVLAAEFENAGNFSGLMRANTPVSRMMTTYTRRGPGQTYLKVILSERVRKLISLQELDLEINPLKVYDQMIQDIEAATQGECDLPRAVTSEVAAANQDVQAIIAPRVKTLMEIGASFLKSTETQKCSLIGGFFMLRFINPAIVTPHMLGEGDPKKNPRRTLTLIAKLLQNLANKPSHTKEPFMSVLNPFVEHNELRFQKFLNDLCEVGDFYESLECPEKDGRLRICLADLGSAPPQLPRKENRSINLSLFSRWDQTNIDTTSSAAADPLTRGEFLYYDAKAIFVQILRLSPAIASKKPLDLDQIIELASTSRDQILVKKGLKLGDMMEDLIKLKQISKNDSYATMKEEIDQELQHLGDLADKINTELQSLQVVYKTIQEHNDYLRSQLETYKAYLQNVRVQSVRSGPSAKAVKNPGPFKYSHQKLESDGVICGSNVPEERYAIFYLR
ncbi:glyceraldehyde-3-phosphate dehydrogenase 1 [Globomyces sp. JEL0801]|nr:glyceraldehyde-3-phosphate dehydrogenase 1 [Globomyces sp. JEL0801]